MEALERDYERATKKILADLKINMTKEESITWVANDWPRMQCIYLQHAVGALFCVPSLLGIGDPSVASSLAICGILSEIGWEVQDLLEVLFVRAFCKNGKNLWPDSIVIIFLIHHSLSIFLGVPMVLFYRNHRSLHWLCFDLQGSAAISLSIAEYTKLLDVSRPSSLRQFKALIFIVCVVTLWSRVIHWVYLCCDLFVTWYSDEAYWFLVIGMLLSVGFTLFSYFLMVKPYCTKFIKFWHVSAEYETLPPDATPADRRASVIKLDIAAVDLLEGDALADLADIVGPIFLKRRPSRRQSVPVQSRKRRSLLMLNSQFSKSFGHDAFQKAKDL